MIRQTIRRACQSGLLGLIYPRDFPIKTCLQWSMSRYEWATLRHLRSVLHRGDVFVDIGAHVGYFAVRAARWVGRTGRVFAFEPHPVNYRMLVRNGRRIPQMVAVQAAVSDAGGQACLFEHSTSTSSHALTDLSGSGRSVPVRAVSLDQWAREQDVRRVKAVLIDVEGHELAVLRGMRRLVSDNPDITIVLEYCPSNHVVGHENTNVLLSEIHGMSLRITHALGQAREYAIPGDASEPVLAERLAGIVLEETARERCDYVNLIARR